MIKSLLTFEIDEDLAGGCSYDKHGTPITDEVFYKALESAVGNARCSWWSQMG
jgi:3-isopropylmalate dehydrogenase